MADDIAALSRRLAELEGRDPEEVRTGLHALVGKLENLSFVDRAHEGLAFSEQGLALAGQVGATRAEAWFLAYRAFARYLLSDHEAALADFKVAEARMRELEDDTGLARILSIMAGTYLSLGDYDQALRIAHDSLRLAERLGDRLSVGWNHHGLATGFQELGDPEQARVHFQRALEVFTEQGHEGGRGRALTGLATTCRLTEDFDQAETYLAEALNIFRAAGIKLGEARALSDLGVLHHRLGHHEEARQHHTRALRLRRELGNRQAQATSLIELGRLAIDEDRLDEARELLDQALDIATEINSKPRIYQAHLALADAHALSEQFDLALAHFQAFHRVREQVLGDQASTRLRNQQVRFAVESAEREAEISRLKNIELGDKNAQLEQLLRELRETQAQLVQSEKMASLGQLVTGMVHELSNPLGALGSAVNVARRSLVRAEDQRRAGDEDGLARSRGALDRNLDIMDDAVIRLTSLIDNLKRYVQLDQAAVQLADLNACLRTTLELVRHQVGPATQVVVDLGDLPRVRCRPGEINQVFMHLLSNAARAAGPRGRITVTSRREGDEVAISVTDDGPGLAPQRLVRLFEPDFSRHGSRVKAGLGLFLSHGIVTNHGGTIAVASEPGHGSTFTVRLPLAGSARA